MAQITPIPILDLTQQRINDGDTDLLISKVNEMQNKFENWSNAANTFRSEVFGSVGLPLAGGTLSGNIVIEKTNNATINLDSVVGGSSNLKFLRQGIDETSINSGIVRTLINRTVGSDAVNLSIYNTYFQVDAPLYGAHTTSGDLNTTLSSKSYVDTKLDLAGGSMTGNLTINHTLGNATLVLNSAAPHSGFSTILYRRDGSNTSLMQSTHTRLLSRWVHSSGGTDTDFSLYNSRGEINKEIRGVSTLSSDHATTLTTKDYVDSVAGVPTSGGEFTGDVTFSNGTSDVGKILLQEKGSNGSNTFHFKAANSMGASYGLKFPANDPLDNSSDWVLKASGPADGSGDVELYWNRAVMSAGGEFTGPVTFSNGANDAGKILFKEESSNGTAYVALKAAPNIFNGSYTMTLPEEKPFTDSRLHTSEVTDSNGDYISFWADNERAHTRKFILDGDSLTPDSAEIEFRTSSLNSLTLKANVSNTDNYTIVFPAGKPSVNQVLKVGSISGETVNMIWAAN